MERPIIVYKYHKINQHLFSLLENRKLWFAHQNELNDPFDCKYAFSDDFLFSLFKRSSESLLVDLKKKNPLLNFPLADDFLKNKLPVLKSKENMNRFYNTLFGEKLGWNVCCFTTNPLNEIMWSHYADNQKGVCLEFDLSKTPQLHNKLFQVNYTDTFPEISSIDMLPTALLTKRTAWNYEDEWRILTNEKGEKRFNRESLSGIYFGCYVSKKTISKIRKMIIKSGYNNLDFKQLTFRIKGVNLTKLDESDTC